MSTSKVTSSAGKRPKPLSRDELDRIVRASGLPEMELRRIVGLPSMGKGREKKPEQFTLMEARGVRMLAVRPELREKVLEVRKFFPGATIRAIREY